ncbi:leucyl/phenylalanyl-tRNA--protein transferase [Suttonella ornithocola]|uniref:leucyl/phenylalanyl-tRNA--protein transferase n=1 Tax=Suttonella ornithocola TaxID=279832 RepID=UPI001FE41582|nr:leucyl/phenylalanyl-tRNA--protein transferase [Suttonella ornithocola]
MNEFIIEPFPPVEQANFEGELARGGSLHPEQVFYAYQKGIFPWYAQDEPIRWWSPNPRGVLFTHQVHCSKSLKKTMRKLPYKITFDTFFSEVIAACATEHGETWITDEMRSAYILLHLQGRAHSCELWLNGHLIGGLYGICLNKVFCGESMFSRQANASKIVLIELCAYLIKQNIKLIDTQFLTEHLISMGAINISRDDYLMFLTGNPDRLRGHWC